MISNRLFVGLGALLAVCAVGSSWWVGKAISGLREEVAAVRDELGTARSESQAQFSNLLGRVTQAARSAAPAAGGEEVAVDPFTGVDFKKVSDIQVRVDAMVGAWRSQNKTDIAQIDDLAGLLVEMDDWLFVPEEQPEANRIIAEEVNLLRRLIKSQVTKLSKAAIAAQDGKGAAKIMTQINQLLSLYPVPSTADDQAALEQITASILSTSRRVEEIRYLRYNQWAISQIEIGLKGYRKELAIGSVQDISKLMNRDREKLRSAAISAMSTIDTAYLTPAAMDLYNYAYTLYRDAMGSNDDSRAKLAKGFADPSVKRRTPADF